MFGFKKASRNHPSYGKGVHRVDAAFSDAALMDGDELIRRVVARFREPSYDPPRLPRAAQRLMVLTQQSRVRLTQLVEVLEQDELLVSNVLKVASSPLYAAGNGVRSIRDALVRLGLNAVRNIVLQESMRMRIFRNKSYLEPMKQLNAHHVATAHLSRQLGAVVGVSPDTAFMAGLLHDIGIIAILLALGDLPRGQTAPPLVGVSNTIHEVHTEASARILELWDMPVEVRVVASHHHHPWLAPEEHRGLAAVVCVAEELATRAGRAVFASDIFPNLDRTPPVVFPKALELLGLDEEQLDLIASQGAETLAQL